MQKKSGVDFEIVGRTRSACGGRRRRPRVGGQRRLRQYEASSRRIEAGAGVAFLTWSREIRNTTDATIPKSGYTCISWHGLRRVGIVNAHFPWRRGGNF